MLLQHIAEAAAWERARATGFYDRSTLGASIEQVGFLHASGDPDQTAGVLSAVYAGVTEPLVLLTLDAAVLYRSGLRVVMEPGDPQRPSGEWFPHVYGGPIPVAAVAEAVPVVRAAPGETVASTDAGPETDPAAQMMDQAHLARAIDLATVNASTDGGPFGAVVVTADGQVFQGTNRVTTTNDPTAHAEVTALREAGAGVGSFDLTGAVLYTSCEPCPMCLSASLWARLDAVWFAADRHDAAAGGFDDAEFYEYFATPEHERSLPVRPVALAERTAPFEAWARNVARTAY